MAIFCVHLVYTSTNNAEPDVYRIIKVNINIRGKLARPISIFRRRLVNVCFFWYKCF